MKSDKTFRLLDLAYVTAIVVILAAILTPVINCLQGNPKDRQCANNLKAICRAIWMYTGDWSGTYPTNRMLNDPPDSAAIAPQITLSSAKFHPNGKPFIFQHGINWVEALYQYVGEPATDYRFDDPGESSSVWRCPRAERWTMPPKNHDNGTYVTYSFNVNFAQTRSSEVRKPNITMMCRELGCHWGAAVLRPGLLNKNKLSFILERNGIKASKNKSGGKPGVMTTSDFKANGFRGSDPDPMVADPRCGPGFDTFLNISSLGYPGNLTPHGEGSFILMADGSVKLFSRNEMPDKCQWHNGDRQWYNSNSLKSIAIVP